MVMSVLVRMRVLASRVRPLVYAVKLWAKRRKIHEPYKGYLSSYSYTLLVIHYLQREGVLLCLQDLGRQDAVANNHPDLTVLSAPLFLQRLPPSHVPGRGRARWVRGLSMPM